MEETHQELKTQNELMSKFSTQIRKKLTSVVQEEKELFDEAKPSAERLNGVLKKEMDLFDEPLPVAQKLNHVP